MWPNPDPAAPQHLGQYIAILGLPWGPLPATGTLPCCGGPHLSRGPSWPWGPIPAMGTISSTGTMAILGTPPCHGGPHPCHGGRHPPREHSQPRRSLPGPPLARLPPEFLPGPPPARPVGSPVSPPGRDRPRDSPIFFKALPGRRGPPEPSDGERGCSAAGRAFLPQIIVRGRCPGTPGTPGSPGSPGAPGPDGAPGRCSRAGRRRRTGLGLAWGWAAPSGPGPGAGKYREEPRFSPDGVNCLCPPGPRGGCR